MKRLFLIILLSWAVCITNAAPLPFTVEPVKWSKLAKNNTDEVNIRKAPSTTAPRLVYQPIGETCEIPQRYWGTATLRGNEHAAHFWGEAPVVSEVDGWYELQGIGPDGSNGWVSAKYCDVVNLKDARYKVVPGEYNTPDFVWLKDEEGAYYTLYYQKNDMEGGFAFYVGREIDGFVVCPYVFFCGEEYSNEHDCGLYKTDYNIVFVYGDKQKIGYFEIDLRQVPFDVIQKIFWVAEPMDNPAVIYRNDGNYVAIGCVPLD